MWQLKGELFSCFTLRRLIDFILLHSLSCMNNEDCFNYCLWRKSIVVLFGSRASDLQNPVSSLKSHCRDHVTKGTQRAGRIFPGSKLEAKIILAKELLIIGLFCGKRPVKIWSWSCDSDLEDSTVMDHWCERSEMSLRWVRWVTDEWDEWEVWDECEMSVRWLWDECEMSVKWVKDE